MQNLSINTDQFSKLAIPIPPLSIQQQIVKSMETAYARKRQQEEEADKILNSIDAFVLQELGITVPETKESKCYTVLSEDVADGRVDTDYHQPKFAKLKQAFASCKYKIETLKNFIVEIRYGVSTDNAYVNEGIPLLRIMNLKPNRLDLTDVVKLPEAKREEIGKGLVSEGDTLISRSGSIGIVAVVPKEAEGFAFGSFMIKFRINETLNKRYVATWLNTSLAKLFTEREKIGAIQGNITIPTIENFMLPTPPREIQDRISDEVRRRLVEAARLRSAAGKTLEATKQEVEALLLGK